eukprot:1802604-Rhodomonas_salina.1
MKTTRFTSEIPWNSIARGHLRGAARKHEPVGSYVLSPPVCLSGISRSLEQEFPAVLVAVAVP